MSRTTIAVRAALGAVCAVAAIAPVIALGGALKSGVELGAKLPAYNPTHVTGPDKNTQTCPVCKYPYNPAVQAWINTDDEKNAGALVSALEKTSKDNPNAKLKAFVVFMNPKREAGDAIAKRLAALGSANKAVNVSISYLPGPTDEAVQGYGINTDAKVRNTIFVYKNRTVSSKFVNLTADAKGVSSLNEAIKQVL